MRQKLITLEQDDLLFKLVQAARFLKLTEQVEFHLISSNPQATGAWVAHPGLPGGQLAVDAADVEVLLRKGLLRESKRSAERVIFDIDPRGYEAHARRLPPARRPVPRMGITARAYMDGGAFERTFPVAYEKWAQAEALLPQDDLAPSAGAIHDLCSDALGAFAGYLERRLNCAGPGAEALPTAARIGALLECRDSGLDESDRPFLSALLANWSALLERVQAQEGATPDDGGTPHWQDLHLAVFHTAVVMFEINRALVRGW